MCEEDIEPAYLENKDHMSPTRSSFNERAEACDEYLKDLMKLDSETDKDLESLERPPRVSIYRVLQGLTIPSLKVVQNGKTESAISRQFQKCLGILNR